MLITPVIKRLRNIHICLVEADPLQRMRIEQILNKYEFYNRSFFESFASAAESIEIGTIYDLIIIDWNKDGSEDFCKRVNKLQKAAPMIFITTSSAEDYFCAFEAGAIDCIKTPINENDFLEAVWSAFNIELYRREWRVQDILGLKKQCLFRFQQNAAQA